MAAGGKEVSPLWDLAIYQMIMVRFFDDSHDDVINDARRYHPDALRIFTFQM